MLYIERDETGSITAIHNAPQANANETKSTADEEILAFLNGNTIHEDSKKLMLSLSDKGLIRLIEDLIDLLIQKKIISYMELPEHAREKIQERNRLRENISCHCLTVDDIL